MNTLYPTNMLVVDVYMFTYQNLASVDSVPTPTYLVNEYHSMGIPTQVHA